MKSILLVLLSFLIAGQVSAQTVEVKFRDGKTFVFVSDDPGEGLYLKKKKSQELLISGEPVRCGQWTLPQTPPPGYPADAVIPLESDSEIEIAQVGNRIFALLSSGEWFELTFDPDHIRNRRYGKGYHWAKREFEYGEHRFFVVDTSDSRHTGSLFIIRDDGFYVQSLMFQFVTDPKVTIETDDVEPAINDGILSFAHSPRKIDLDRFEEEAAQISSVPKEVQDGEGKPVDPIRTVDSLFRNWAQDPVIRQTSYPVDGESEVLALRKALAKRTVASAVLLGSGGTGKTELIKSFVAGISRGDYPEIPRTTRVLYLDPATLGAGTNYTGAMASRIKALVEYAAMGPTIFIMDEIHSFRGLGTHSNNSNDIFQDLKPLLASGQLRILGTSTEAEFNRAFVGDAPLYQRFQQIHRSEWKREKVFKALKNFIRMNKYTKPSDDVLNLVIDLSDEFNAIDAQPRKAIKLLEEVYSTLIVEGRRRATPQASDVKLAAKTLYEVNEEQFDPQARITRLHALRGRLDARIVGQGRAKDAMVEAAYQSLSGARDPIQARMKVLFTGDKGLGKTELAIAYAEEMGLKSHRIEMNRYAAADPKEVLREVALAMRKSPFTVIIFDEIEKASPSVQNALLALLDRGKFTVNESLDTSSNSNSFVEVSVKNASLIFTTNAGKNRLPELIRKLGFSPAGQAEAATTHSNELNAQIQGDGISEFLLDRLDDIISFEGFTREEYTEIIRMYVNRFLAEQSKVQEKEIKLPVDPETLIEDIASKTYSTRVSARKGIREVKLRLRQWLAHSLVDGGENCREYLGV